MGRGVQTRDGLPEASMDGSIEAPRNTEMFMSELRKRPMWSSRWAKCHCAPLRSGKGAIRAARQPASRASFPQSAAYQLAGRARRPQL
jgi:hypothetical protein